MAEAVVRARDLVKRYDGVEAVRGVSFDVGRGECFGLLGPNGAGKTTTIRLVNATSPRSGGELRVFDLDAERDARAIKRRIGLVPQENNLDPDFTVRRNLLVYARYFDMPAREAAARADELLRFVELDEKADEAIDRLSGGMKRRLIIARALLHDPGLLVLDEPTTGLDPQARHLIWDRVRELKRRGLTVLLTTHYMEEAEQLCDRLVIMDRGRILEQGSPRDLVATHARRDVLEVALRDGAEPSHGAGLRALAAEHGATRVEESRGRFFVYGDDLDALQHAVVERLPVAEVGLRRATLEDVFLLLTGRGLRD